MWGELTRKRFGWGLSWGLCCWGLLFLFTTTSVTYAAEPYAQIPLPEFKQLIGRVATQQEQSKLKDMIIKHQAELVKIKEEKDKVQTEYIAKIEQANDTIQAYATKLEEHNARLEQQIAERPIDWVLVAEVATATITARWGGGHLWRWGKVLIGR